MMSKMDINQRRSNEREPQLVVNVIYRGNKRTDCLKANRMKDTFKTSLNQAPNELYSI